MHELKWRLTIALLLLFSGCSTVLRCSSWRHWRTTASSLTSQVQSSYGSHNAIAPTLGAWNCLKRPFLECCFYFFWRSSRQLIVATSWFAWFFKASFALQSFLYLFWGTSILDGVSDGFQLTRDRQRTWDAMVLGLHFDAMSLCSYLGYN